MDASSSESLFTTKTKLNGKMGVDFFFTFELLHPNMRASLQLIAARTSFWWISGSPEVSLRIFDSWLYTRRISLRNENHNETIDMLAYTSVRLKYLETLSETRIIPVKQNQLFPREIFENAPVRWTTIAANTSCTFNWSCTENYWGINSSISDKFDNSDEVNQ